MKLLHLDRARAEGAAPGNPRLCPIRRLALPTLLGPSWASKGEAQDGPSNFHSGQTVLSKGAGRGRAFGPSIAVHCNNREIRGIYGNLSCTSRKEAG